MYSSTQPRFWWFCHLWNEFGCHTYHRSFWYFHKDLVCRVWQCDPCFCTPWLADSALIAAPIINLPGRLVESFLHLVQSPFRIFTLSESLPEVLFSFWSNSGLLHMVENPVGEGLNDTKLGWEVMVAVPLQILVSMCGFPVYSDGQRTISLWFNNSIQEGDGAILLVVLYCKTLLQGQHCLCVEGSLVSCLPCG